MSVSVPSLPRATPAVAEEGDGTWWLIGGVGAELSDRLGAPVGFIRLLLLLGMFLLPDSLYLYAFAALLMPHAGRRGPGWSNVIAVARTGLVVGLVWLLAAAGGGLVNNGGTVFAEGPAVWLPLAGATLFGVVVLVVTGRPSALRDARRDRSVALAILTTLAGLGVVAGAIELVPSVRWDSAIGVLAVLGGLGLAAGGRRGQALLVPVGLLAACAVLLASAGVRLQGGIGDRSLQPLAATGSDMTYRRAVGNLELDLSAMRPRAGLVTITASVGIGDLNIVVPNDAQVTGSIHVGRGSLEALTCTTSVFPHDWFVPRYGVDDTRVVSIGATQPGCGRALGDPGLRLRILASVGIGTLKLTEPPYAVGGAS
jgi:hypothetical protein